MQLLSARGVYARHYSDVQYTPRNRAVSVVEVTMTMEETRSATVQGGNW